MAHREKAATLQVLKRMFWWRKMTQEVSDLVVECIFSLMSFTGEKISRLLASTLHISVPIYVLHFDYLSLGAVIKVKNTPDCSKITSVATNGSNYPPKLLRMFLHSSWINFIEQLLHQCFGSAINAHALWRRCFDKLPRTTALFIDQQWPTRRGPTLQWKI